MRQHWCAREEVRPEPASKKATPRAGSWADSHTSGYSRSSLASMRKIRVLRFPRFLFAFKYQNGFRPGTVHAVKLQFSRLDLYEACFRHVVKEFVFL